MSNFVSHKPPAVPLAAQNAILAHAPIELGRRRHGRKADLAWTYYCAHRALLYLQRDSGASGQVSEEKVGDVMRKYAVARQSTGGDPLNETKVGQRATAAARRDSEL